MKNMIFKILLSIQVLAIISGWIYTASEGDMFSILIFQFFIGIYQLIEGGLSYVFFRNHPDLRHRHRYFIGVLIYFGVLFVAGAGGLGETFMEVWLIAAWALALYHLFIQYRLSEEVHSSKFLGNISF